MKLKNKILISVTAIIVLSGFITRDNDIYFEINKGIDIFGRVYREVAVNYVDELNPSEFMLSGINGMLTSLDPYTNFLDANGQRDIEIITKGKYGGIGATIGMRNDNITVVELIEGFSAQRQGIKVGDVIIKINDTEISKDNFEKLSEFLKGDPGTTVRIQVKREAVNEKLEFSLVREEIEIKNISYYGFIPEESNDVYLKLSGFNRAAGEEIKSALLELKSKKEISSIILDLRGNPGGLLDAAIDVCEKFLAKDKKIVSVKGRDSLNTKNYISEEEPIAGKVKMAVLIDEGSASASEIVAGALQDHDRAVIVGTNSYGKGLVQTIIPLSYNNSLKITTARYFTPSGRSIQKISYSDKNKVYEKNINLQKSQFSTDNRRKVYSAGGVMPDSLVKDEVTSGLIQKLLADGMFFRFATNYFNTNVNVDLKKISSESLLKAFNSYLSLQHFEFVSNAEKLIDQLKKAAKEENLDPKFIEYLNQTSNQIDVHHSNEIEKYKESLISHIKEEFEARVNGRKGRIKEALKADVQFSTAHNILKNNKLYDKLLNIN